MGKQLLIRGSKGTRKVTLTEEGMILRKRAEEILSLVQKTEREISFSDQMIVGDVYIGTVETSAVRFIAKAAKELYESSEISLLTLYIYKIPFFSLLCARSPSMRKNTHKLPLSHL